MKREFWTKWRLVAAKAMFGSLSQLARKASFRFSERGFWLNNCPSRRAIESRRLPDNYREPLQRFTAEAREKIKN
jgi:hypothetical protein